MNEARELTTREFIDWSNLKKLQRTLTESAEHLRLKLPSRDLFLADIEIAIKKLENIT